VNMMHHLLATHPECAAVFAPLWQDVRIKALQAIQPERPGAGMALVGGAVRDMLLNPAVHHPLEDLDVVVWGVDVKCLLEQLMAHDASLKVVPLDEAWGIYRVLFLAHHTVEGQPLFLDIAQALNNSLMADLHRRDLTLNALAVTLSATPEFYEVPGGLADLKHRCLRMIHPRNFLEDPLRLLRLFRFHACLSSTSSDAFTLDAATLDAAKSAVPRLRHVAHERISYEWLRLLAAPQAWKTLMDMERGGILDAFLPELRALKCVPPNTHHHLPLWEHTLELIRHVEETLPAVVDVQTLETLEAPWGQGANGWAVLKMACLLHDIAKPHTWAVDEDTRRHRFIGHEAQGEALAQGICKRFRFSQAITQGVMHLVRWHLYPCTFHTESTEKSRMRFYRNMGEFTPLLCALAYADTLSTRGPACPEPVVQQRCRMIEQLLGEYWETQQRRNTPPLLNGRDIMAITGLSPGKTLGNVMVQFREAQELGAFTTSEAAREWLIHEL
jgi:poly(A) polymerase